VPSDKRVRQRAGREARQAAQERRQRRRTSIRRAVIIVVLAGVAAGIYALVSSGSPAKATKSTTTTSPAATSTTATTLPPNVASSTTTVPLTGDTTSANCPTPFTATTALKKPKFNAPPPMIIDAAKNYSATVYTDAGSFTFALDPKDAPNTVNNFVFLAENHFYDCVVFHRVIPQFMDQTGDPGGTGSGGPGYSFGNENDHPTGGYVTGEVAMANTGQPNSDGSQFFVLAAPYNNTGYSLFGHITAGQSVVNKINSDGSGAGTPTKLHRMIAVIISES